MKLKLISGLLMLSIGATVVQAKVSDEEAAKLGNELTELGGEKAGNAEGTIPEWTGKWLGLPPGLKYDGPGAKRPNPYESEKPLFSITAENIDQHKDHLSVGQVAMFNNYPKTFRMDIYPSHRDFRMNKLAAERTKWNASHTELANGVESLKNYTGSAAFPIPQGPEEMMWNTRTNACSPTYGYRYDNFGVFSNGDRVQEQNDIILSYPYANFANPVGQTEETTGDRIVFNFSGILLPTRDKGQITAVQDPLDYEANSRNAWQYNPGTRRVRKAPAIGYDNPHGPGGLMTIDDQKGFNGAFDRYNYKFLGKKEIYVPYHNYSINDPAKGDLDDRLTKFHIKPDYIRWELHRVWVVEANLAEGKRHAYKKRRWYLDEDSWNPVMAENYDGRGNLWRLGLLLSDYQYDMECYIKHVQVFYDLPSGHYSISFMTLAHDEPDYTMDYHDKPYFTPANLRKKARR